MPYFDNNATTPLEPGAQQALINATKENWANPSSPYRSSAQVRAAIQKCRESICSTLEVDPDLLTFTSGATEANNSIFSNLAKYASQSARVLLSPFEHPSVSEAAHFWFSDRVDVLSALPNGTISTDEITEYLKQGNQTALVAVMAASNESGVIQPWREIARLCQANGIPYHCDSTQLPGKEDLKDLSICSFHVASAHKFGGPKGVGWLVGEEGSSLMVGGAQEKGRRGGTENYPAISSACSAWKINVKASIDLSGLVVLRDKFEEQMKNLFPGIKFIGQEVPRLWNTSLFIMPHHENLKWVGKLDKFGFQVSTGSACSTIKTGGSPIAIALGLSNAETQRLIRVSSFQSHTQNDWHSLAAAFKKASDELDAESTDSSVISL